MGITLNNTADGGATNLTLDYIIGYTQSGSSSTAVKSVPNKSTPTVDTDTTVRNPTRYLIQARVTPAQKVLLEVFRGEIAYQCKLTDNELSSKNVRPINVDFVARIGYDDSNLPWTARMVLQAEDH